MGLIKEFFKIFIYFIIFTAIGQIRIGDTNLENKYHTMVNQQWFQSLFSFTMKKAKNGLGEIKDQASEAIKNIEDETTIENNQKN